MNLKKLAFKIPAALGLACLLVTTGCSTDKESIPFSDDHTQPHSDTNSLPASKVTSLPREDEVKIELQVFSDLLTRHFWDDGGYTAIFLRADDAEIKALQQRFAGRMPPVKDNYRIDLQPNQAPRDLDTGKPAMILSVDLNEPEPDGSVTAVGKWFAGGAVTGFYTYQLKKNDENWEILNLP